MSDEASRGRFVWHELMTTDTKAAADYYTRVIGWKTQPGPHDPSYLMFTNKGRPLGGVMLLPADAKAMGTPPNWLTYIGTPSVDDTVRDAGSLGARILRQPMDVPNVGRFAILQDPQGAVFAVYTSAQPSGPDEAPALGEYSWHELSTSDPVAALGFYGRLFGWVEQSAMDMGPEMGKYHMYGRQGGRTLGGMMRKPPQMPGPPAWLPYIRVPNAKTTAAAMKSRGGNVANTMEVPGGDWIAQAFDPQGAFFSVHSLAADMKKPGKPGKSGKPGEAGRSGKAAKPARKAAKKAKPKKAAKKKAARKATPKKAGKKKAGKKKAAKKKRAGSKK